MPQATIPLTAWEQAGIVCLFAALIWMIVWYNGRQDGTRRKAEDNRTRTFMDFIEKRDRDWQNFLREVRETDCQRHDATQAVLEKLTNLIVEHAEEARKDAGEIKTAIAEIKKPARAPKP